MQKILFSKASNCTSSRRIRLANQCYLNDALRWQQVATRAVEISQTGRPVLVGTRSVEASEKLHALLQAAVDRTATR